MTNRLLLTPLPGGVFPSHDFSTAFRESPYMLEHRLAAWKAIVLPDVRRVNNHAQFEYDASHDPGTALIFLETIVGFESLTSTKAPASRYLGSAFVNSLAGALCW